MSRFVCVRVCVWLRKRHQRKETLCTVPVSEAGLCVTHWASGSRFAENCIRLTFSREWWGGFPERRSLAFVWGARAMSWMTPRINESHDTVGLLRDTSEHLRTRRWCQSVKRRAWRPKWIGTYSADLCKNNRGLCRLSCTAGLSPTPAMQNKYTCPFGTSCMKSSYEWFTFTSQFTAALKPVNSPRPTGTHAPALRCSPCATTPDRPNDSGARAIFTVLGNPPVPFGCPAPRNACLRPSRLPWPWDTLGAELAKKITAATLPTTRDLNKVQTDPSRRQIKIKQLFWLFFFWNPLLTGRQAGRLAGWRWVSPATS